MTEKTNFYKILGDRYKYILRSAEKGGFLEPPEIDDWPSISEDDNWVLQDYLNKIYYSTRNITGDLSDDETNKMNADKDGLDEHIKIGLAYLGELWSHPLFREPYENSDITSAFTEATFILHDLGRYVGNGSMRLDHQDQAAGVLLDRLFPNFPKEFLHSIHWITGKEESPISSGILTIAQKHGLILKTVDTLSKKGKADELRDPLNIEEEIDNWRIRQEEYGTFPFSIPIYRKGRSTVRRDISSSDYAVSDIAHFRAGLEIIEERTGVSIMDIRKKVQPKTL